MSEFKSEVKLDITLLYARINRFLFELDQMIADTTIEDKDTLLSQKFAEICELWREVPIVARTVTITEPIIHYGIKIGQQEKVQALLKEVSNPADRKILKDRFLL